MNKFLFVFLLFSLCFCASSNLSDLIKQAQTAANNVSAAANKAATTASNTAGSLSGKVNQLGQRITQINETMVSQANITAAQLANALAQIRNAAESKIDMIDELLNKTSSTEKAVVENAFEVVDTIIKNINTLTNMNITNEYEAAEVSAYVQEKISQANDLLSAVRKYINEYVDKANDTIRDVASAIKIPDSVSTYVGAASAALETLASAIDELKGSYNITLEEINGQIPSVSEALANIDLSNVSYEDVMDAIAKIGANDSSLAKFVDSLPSGKTKDKLAQIVAAIQTTANTITSVANSANQIFNSGKQIYETGKATFQTIKNMFK